MLGTTLYIYIYITEVYGRNLPALIVFVAAKMK